ncbi:hypothetical protein SLA2020_426310 [Shorea laevis]
MIQLVAVACLSLAAKVEETQVPLLLDLQVRSNTTVGALPSSPTSTALSSSSTPAPKSASCSSRPARSTPVRPSTWPPPSPSSPSLPLDGPENRRSHGARARWRWVPGGPDDGDRVEVGAVTNAFTA